MKPIRILPALCLAALLIPNRAPADDASAAASFQTRMRETLRNTMQQLSDAQNQVATLQATQAQSDKDKADLSAKVDALTALLKSVTQQAAADRDASAKSIAALNEQTAAETKQIGALDDALSQWKVAYNQMTALAKSTEEKRAELDTEATILKRVVDDREVKNAELYNTGMEILTRYEKFGLGEALEAKEPFVGVTRVRLEELVQDYKDKLLDRRVIPGQPVPTPPSIDTVSNNPVRMAQATPRKTP